MATGENHAARDATARFEAKLARGSAEIQASQRLRFRVFAQELGANIHTCAPGVETDEFDPYCQHLLVRDTSTGRVISSTRILTGEMSEHSGGFYSEGEFELGNIAGLPGNTVEIGRTCVDPDFRSGTGIGMLWAGLARFIAINRVNYLIGCASIPMRDGGVLAHALMNRLRDRHMSPEHLRVRPRLALPVTDTIAATDDAPMPPLLEAYMRLGAWVCGEPCQDPGFGVADVFILLDVDNLQPRYLRHFLRGASVQRSAHALAS